MTRAAQQSPSTTGAGPDGGSTLYVFIVSSVAAIGGLLFGFDTAIVAGAGEFVQKHFRLNDIEQGWVVSSLLIGCMFGAGMGGPVADRLGRKKVLLATAALYVLSAIASGIPAAAWQLMAARFVGGLAVGASSMICPMYIAEIAPARIRGTLVTMQQMAIVIGILLANVVSGLLVEVSHNWQWMFASAAVPAFLLLIALFTVPESPRWLAKQGLDQHALDILARVGGRGHAENEMAEIRLALDSEEGTLSELLGPGLRPALIIGVVLAILGQISGINTVIYYAPSIFKKAGFEQDKVAVWTNVLVGATNFVSTIISLAVIDKVGRRVLLLIGSAGMAVSMGFAGSCMTSDNVPMLFKIVVILAYIASFAVGVGGVVWVVISEIFPTKIRGVATSVAVVSVWGACFLVSLTFLWLLGRLGERVFYIYSALSLAMGLFVFFVIPETKGQSLEAIERMWKRQKA
jgi:sugar porter (SP) family MFS transporter